MKTLSPSVRRRRGWKNEIVKLGEELTRLKQEEMRRASILALAKEEAEVKARVDMPVEEAERVVEELRKKKGLRQR